MSTDGNGNDSGVLVCEVKWGEKASQRRPLPLWDPLRFHAPIAIEFFVRDEYLKEYVGQRSYERSLIEYRPNWSVSPALRGVVAKPDDKSSKGSKEESLWPIRLPRLPQSPDDGIEFDARIVSANEGHDGELHYSRYYLEKQVPDREAREAKHGETRAVWIIRDDPWGTLFRFFGFWVILCAIPGALMRSWGNWGSLIEVPWEAIKRVVGPVFVAGVEETPLPWPDSEPTWLQHVHWVEHAFLLPPILLFFWTLCMWAASLAIRPRKPTGIEANQSLE